MIATAVLVVISAFTSNVAFGLAGLGPLLIAVAWTLWSDKNALHQRLDGDLTKLLHHMDTGNRELSNQLEAIRRAQGVTIHARDNAADAYVHAQNILIGAKGHGGWESIRLYAPVGLWSQSSSKDAWINALASELGKTVQHLSVVTALPTDRRVFHDVSAPMLRSVADTPGVDIYYVPPLHREQTAAVPPFGMALFADRNRGEYRTVLAFMSRQTSPHHRVLTHTLVLDGEPVNRMLTDWFEDFLVKSNINNVLLGADWVDGDAESNLTAQIERIEQTFYRL